MSHIFLTGFMGSGKSTVGRLLAERLSMPFVDLDAAVTSAEGGTPAELFESRGEQAFRDAEHHALKALENSSPSVVATGGGVVLRDENRTLLSRLGTVIYLSVTPEAAMARLGDTHDRPLLAGKGIAAARHILGARVSLYAATADHVVDATDGVDEVVASILTHLSAESEDVIHVSAGDGYDVRIGRGVLADAGVWVREATSAHTVALVSDETVWPLHGEVVESSLREAGVEVSAHVVVAGESAKSWTNAGGLLEAFAAAGLDRGSAVVALGGGVVGDLAGFVAAVYMRGIRLVHIPTTLLAQVDSSLGGKTAVDLTAGKNLAGAFWQPRLVLTDPDVLGTLPAIEWTNGLVEAAKAALLAGGAALDRFESDAGSYLSRDPSRILAMVTEAARFKAGVVSDDEREADVRESLNLGHTLGHAIELVTGYGAVPHGIAVAIGMRFAARLAECELGASPEVTSRIEALLERIGAGAGDCAAYLAPVRERLTTVALLAAMKSDKKSRDGVVRFVLLTTPGAWEARAVADEVVVAALEAWLETLADGKA